MVVSSSYDDNKGYIVVLIAITNEKETFNIDANMKLVLFGNEITPIDKNILVHSGFNKALFFNHLPWKILNYIISSRERFPFYKLCISSHSIGRALSQLFFLLSILFL